jgi:hypothetical protein
VPQRDRITKVYDTAAGMFRVDAANRRRIMDAARVRGRLMAIHAALAGGEKRSSRRRPARSTASSSSSARGASPARRG